MKVKLLLVFALVCLAMGQARATAFPVPDLTSCSVTFDLSPQISIALGNQDPQDFTVSFFETQDDAENNASPIMSIMNYSVINPNSQTLYLRVTNNLDQTYEIVTFQLIVQTVIADELSNVMVCGSYTLPALSPGNYYYLDPGGFGNVLEAGSIISETTTIYVYVTQNGCSDESVFQITVAPVPVIQTLAPLTVCGSNIFDFSPVIAAIGTWNAPGTEVTFYHSLSDALNLANPIITTTSYTGTDGEIIYVAAQNGFMCTETGSFELNTAACGGSTISGTVRVDFDANGCSTSDAGLAGFVISNTQDNVVTHAYTNDAGQYQFTNVTSGANYTAIDATSLPAHITPVDPSGYAFVVADNTNNTGDFCLEFTEFKDLGVHVFSLTDPRPQNFSTYYLRVDNAGNMPATGTVTFTFDPFTQSLVDPDGGTVSGNTITFDINALPPAGQLTFEITLFVYATVEPGQINLVQAAASLVGDENFDNDFSNLYETIVNSLDPNEIDVHEGALITQEQASQYLHYTVHFQNIGSADALEVRIENELSPLLDWSTFRPVAASHSYFTQRMNGNVTFHFNNINLPGSDNEPASHGFVTYEVKPVSSLAIGQIIENNANIFFDFNAPIETNTVTTQIINLGTQVNSISDVVLYPNPGHNKIFLLGSISNATIFIADLSGKQLLTKDVTFESGQALVDISGLASGIYVVKMVSGGDSVTRKLLVN